MRTINAQKSERDRLDTVLVKRGLVPSRQRAQAFIMEGRVWVDGKRVEK
ncbi:MAG: TlyA family RNA methyltransferase, partial [Deltaproteobacteria bacterium]|nr:TlyA family RNA methyltransferase [Deltaproteobacteria bacterium]